LIHFYKRKLTQKIFQDAESDDQGRGVEEHRG